MPNNSTCETQPVDAGLGRLLKVLVSRESEAWLETDDNLDTWENGKLCASERRILVTQFVGAAWEKLFSSPEYTPNEYFERTGCLLTLDCSEDHKINIEGTPDYKPVKVAVDDDPDDPIPEPVTEEAEEEPDSNFTDDDDIE